MSLADKPAFPALENWRQGSGMTLLEHYAGLAMQGDFASQNEITGEFMSDTKDVVLAGRAGLYVRAAKALIAELEKVRS